MSPIKKIINSDIFKYGSFTYFTNFPYILHNTSTRAGNMAYAGVGLGLIQCQQMFWISNTSVFIVFFNNYNNIDYYSVNYWLLALSVILYGYSFAKIVYLVRFLR
jgi:hypothetical protein